MNDFINLLRLESQRLGFTNIGWAPIAQTETLQRQLRNWLAAGQHGTMQWMARNSERRGDPCQIVGSAKTVISVSCNYLPDDANARNDKGKFFSDTKKTPDGLSGKIARYAWGNDYHDIMLPRLKELLRWLQEKVPGTEGIAYVDTGPVLEKPWAARAGLGWQGKHTNLIDPKRGSWFFLGEIITSLAFPPSGKKAADPPSLCGKCTRCIDVCPTRAITGPYRLDARRCIAYLTIEYKGSIPLALRPLLGQHIYGCDLCQDVCPWNRFATPTPDPAFAPRPGSVNPALLPLMTLTDEQFRNRFRGSPIFRIKRSRFLRNVAVALGNSHDRAALPVLQQAANDADPLIAEHAQWAIAQITGK